MSYKAKEYIYRAMGDDISKDYYEKRIDYSNGEKGALKAIVNTIKTGSELIEFMDKNHEHLYIFGAGMLGIEFVRNWKADYNFIAFVDNDKNKVGSVNQFNMPVLQLDQVKDVDAAFIIIPKFYSKVIENQIIQFGYKKDKAIALGEKYRLLSQEQYFDLNVIDKEGEEIFIDCGACDGMTSMLMKEKYRNTKHIYLFEPDPLNVQKCRGNLEKIGCEVEIIEKGVWSFDGELRFDSKGNASSVINEDGNEVVKVQSIDSLLNGQKSTFIKMDIEGAELEALKGAENTIRKYKPKLAICIYHKKEDIEIIPEIILKYNPNYKLYIRHYSQWGSETVLYAIP